MNKRVRKRQLYANARLSLLADAARVSAESAIKPIDEMLRTYDIKKYGGEVMTGEPIGKEKIE